MVKDLLYALRTLRSQPGFVLIAVCSLAIGIGANSAIYSFADALLLRPLAITRPNEVMAIKRVTSGKFGAGTAISYPDYVELRKRNRSFSGMAGSAWAPFGFAPDKKTQPRMRLSLFVSANFLDTLGLKPSLGRGFRPEEETQGKDQVVVLSHDVWVSDFEADPNVIGRTVYLNGTDFTVVGVAPESFRGLDQVKEAMFVPITMAARLWEPAQLTDRSRSWVSVRGRLRPGVNLAQANGDIGAISESLRHDYPTADQTLRLQVETELASRIQEQPPNAVLLVILAALAACVLLIACGNVAGLLVARGAGRAREIAVRLAMGASRASLIKQLLLENLLLAVGGGVIGLLFTAAATQFFNSLPIPTDVPVDLRTQVDERALLFTFAVSIGSVLLFGLVPALRSTRLDLNSALKEKAGTSSRGARFWGRSVIVSGQVALSFTLLAVAMVLYNGFRAELEQGPGYKVDGVQMMSFDGSLVHYDEHQMHHFYTEVRRQAKILPNVRAVALTSAVPLGVTGDSVDVVPEGYSLPHGERSESVMKSVITPEYFEVLRLPVTQGRNFTEQDRADSAPVVVVNEHMAQHYWPHQSALGKRVRLGPDGKWAEVVGIAKTTKYLWVSESPMDFIYQPFAQTQRSDMILLAEANHGDPAGLVPELRGMVHGLDPNMPVYDVRTMANLYHDRAQVTPQYIVKTVSGLGVLALVLSCIGLYGIVSFVVGRRTREFGIRMAVGAPQQRIAGMVLGNALKLGGAGIVVGIVLSVFAVEGIRSGILFSFEHVGSYAYVAVSLLLLCTIALAAYAPARRASRIDPMRALREE